MRGLTLLEALITLAVVAIVLGFGAPAMAGLLNQARLTTLSNELSGAIHQTRSQAILNNRSAIVCAGTPQQGCDNTYSWSEGWFVFVDRDNNRQYNADEDVKLINQGNDANVQVRSSRRAIIVFDRFGRAAGSNTRLSFCTAGGVVPRRALVLANSGRLRLEMQPSEGSC